MRDPSWASALLWILKKRSRWEAEPKPHVSVDPSNVQDDIRGAAFGGHGRGASVLFRRTPAPSEIRLASAVPTSDQSLVSASTSSESPILSPPRHSSITLPSRTSSNKSSEDGLKSVGENVTYISVVVPASLDRLEPQSPSDSKVLDWASNLPEDWQQAGTKSEAKQNADSQPNSYFASNGSAPLAKERDTLAKLFDSYRG
jgi:hypothetical protein